MVNLNWIRHRHHQRTERPPPFAALPVQRPDTTPAAPPLDGGHEQAREVATRYAAPARTAQATTARP